VETAAGPVQVAQTGAGPPILIIHGAGGGFDQALAAGRLCFGESYHVIAPSRFGYLGSPVPQDASLEAQADTYASLLDTLDIERVVVMGISAGGPSTLHFATRHPGRVRGLILYSAISYQESPSPDELRKMTTINRIIGSDVVYWLAISAARPLLLELFGVSRPLQSGLPAVDRAILDQALVEMLPMSERIPGVVIDQAYHFPRTFPLEAIKAPTLVFHARDDTLVPFDRGLHSARKIPAAELIAFEQGGHFLAGHAAEVRTRISCFLNNC
jgi:pimeloyl-ACP methyl ester carboxylesterase